MSWFGALLARRPGHVRAAIPAGTTWANGYLYRSDLHIDRLLVSGGLSGARAWMEVDVTGLDEESGLDIRVEDAVGNKLPHKLLVYDAGEARLRIKLPTLAVDQNTVIAVYTGKAGADEADEAGLYAGLLMAIDPVTGRDMSGNSRDFTSTGVIAGTMSDGWPGGVYTGASFLQSADSASWLAGAAECAMLVDMDVDAAMDNTTSRIFAQGDYFNPGGSDSLQLGRLAVTSGGVPDVWFNTIYTSLALSAYTLGAAESAASGLALLVGSWESGLAPDVFVNGAAMPTSLEVARAGTVQVRTGGWYIGQGFIGKLGEILLSPDPVSPLQADIEGRSRRRPMSLWGRGAWRQVSDPEPCVAMPVRVSVVEEVESVADLLEPALGSSLSVISVTQGQRGTVTLDGGVATYTSDDTGPGSDWFTFTIQAANGSQSTGRCDVSISAAPGGGGSGDPGAGTVLPTPDRIVPIASQAALNAAVVNFQDGDRLLLANGNYQIPGNAWTWSSSNAAKPLQLVAENLLGAVITADFSMNGSNFILYGLDLPARKITLGFSAQSNNVKIWRCRWRDLPEQPNDSNIGLRTYACDRLDYAYCTVENWKGRGVALGPDRGTTKPTIRRSLFRNTGTVNGVNGFEAVQAGFGFADRWVDMELTLSQCLFKNWLTDDETVSIKSSANLITECRFEGNAGRLGNRLGWNNVYRAIKFIGSAGIRIHDRGCKVLGCDVGQASQGVRVATGDFPVLNEMFTSSSPSTPNAFETLVEGTIGNVEIGAAYSGDTIKANATVLRNQISGSVTVTALAENTTNTPAAAATESWPALFAATDAAGSENVGVFGS